MYYKLALRMLWCRGLTNWNRVFGVSNDNDIKEPYNSVGN